MIEGIAELWAGVGVITAAIFVVGRLLSR